MYKYVRLVGFGAPFACDPTSSFSCLVSSGRGDEQFTQLADVLPADGNCNFDLDLWRRNEWMMGRYWSPKDGIDDIIFHDDDGDGDNAEPRGHHLTYGEVTPLGVRQLAYEMGIAKCSNGNDRNNDSDYDETEINEEDGNGNGNGIVFCDLGSGVGRLVTQIYLDQPERVTKAIGIELAEDRHKIAIEALNGILQETGSSMAEEHDGEYNEGISTAQCSIELIQGDATEVDLDSTITHVFISSLCFPEDVLITIQEKLLQLPNVRVVAALNRLDMMHQLGGEEWRERIVPIQMTWGASTAKLYHKIT
eukprot:jgi/Psemu1/325596/estExt_fgenesh1_pg.C_2580017